MPDAGPGVPSVIDSATDEVLNRQVHPRLLHPIQVVMSTAFTPSDDDGGLVSTLRGKVAPHDAHDRHVSAGYASAGTWGIAVTAASNLDLACIDDECLPDTPSDHASIDFREEPSKGAQRQKGRKLRDAAVQAGALYRPPLA